jgi:hypothetical protein
MLDAPEGEVIALWRATGCIWITWRLPLPRARIKNFSSSSWAASPCCKVAGVRWPKRPEPQGAARTRCCGPVVPLGMWQFRNQLIIEVVCVRFIKLEHTETEWCLLGSYGRVALVSTDVSEELSTSFIRVTRFGDLGTTLAVTSNRRTLQRNTKPKFLRNVGSYKSHTA